MTSPEHTPHDQLVSRVLDRITGEGLTPRPRWAFLLENYVFWGLGALAVVLGATAFAAGLFEVENVGWRLYTVTHSDFASFFFESVPSLWVVALALFIFIGYMNIRRTRKGYRYSLALIALGAVLTSIPLGTLLYAAGVGERVEGVIGDHPPFYRPIMVRERAWWLAPERGLLGGTVLSSAPDLSTFVLRDFSGEEWTVDAGDLPINDRTIVARGGTVRVIGVSATSTTARFHACFVFPWEVHGSHFVHPAAPIALIASSSATKMALARSEICRGLGPYTRLRAIDDAGF